MKKILRPTIGKRKAMLEQGQKADITEVVWVI